jgi:hypothetical protein
VLTVSGVCRWASRSTCSPICSSACCPGPGIYPAAS